MNSLFRRMGAIAGLIGLIVSGLCAPVSASGTPQLTASPSAQRVNAGDTFKLTLRINPEGTAINTVNIVSAFPPDKLSFVGLDKADAYFDTFIPATPTATDGTLSFAASALGRDATTDSVTVVGLLFKATVDSGSAAVSFDGTQAANGSGAIDVHATDATVNFSAGTGNGTGRLSISAIKVSDVTTTGAAVSWHTSVPTTGTVDYGSSSKYGLSVSSDTASMDHTVDLGKFFAGKTSVHFLITAVASDATTLSSKDQTFSTLGYPVIITVVNSKHQPVKGVRVSLKGHAAVRTGTDGTATLRDVAPGTQEVTAGSGKAQVIVVKAAIGAAAEQPQTFTLKETSSPLIFVLTIVLLLVVVAGGITALRTLRRKK